MRKTKKVLVLGADGQVGRALTRCLKDRADVSLIALGRCSKDGLTGDLTELRALKETVEKLAPDIIFNAAAFTAVDRAESDFAAARAVNASAPAALAELCRAMGCLFVHYGTDYVFDGTGHCPIKETDATNPVNVYGKVKLEGDLAVLNSGCRHFVFRTSWVVSYEGQNFLRSILKLSQDKTELSVVDDQFGVPTTADFIAEISSLLALGAVDDDAFHGACPMGLYNLVPDGMTSRLDFARWIVQTAASISSLKLMSENITGIRSTEWPSAAKRPLYTVLDNSKLKTVYKERRIEDWSVYCRPILQTLLRPQE